MARKALGVNLAGAAGGADLGGGSKYSGEVLETDVEEGFVWTAVEHESVLINTGDLWSLIKKQ